MTKSSNDSTAIIPRHQWTHDGAEVLILKYVAKDGTTYGGFQWPLTVGTVVAAPDFTTVAECGGGLHGWPWGFSLGDGKEPEWAATWIVFGAMPADVIDLGGKVKTRTATIRYVGDWIGANVRNTPSFVRRFTLESFFVRANTTLKSATVKNALIYILFC